MTQVIKELKTDLKQKEKREALSWAGFESILTLNDRTVNPNTKRWFYLNFHWRSSSIRMPDGSVIEFQKDDVRRVYGLPANGLPIKADDAEEHTLNGLINEFELYVHSDGLDDEEKKKGKPVTGRSHIHVKPRANYTVDLAVYAHSLRDIQTIAQFDWCEHLYKALIGAFRYREKYFAGDLYLLECHVLDKYSEGKVIVPPPTCAVWTTNMCIKFGAGIKYPAIADVKGDEEVDEDQPVAKRTKCHRLEKKNTKLQRFFWLKKEMDRLVGVIQQANTEINSLMNEFLQLGTELGIDSNPHVDSTLREKNSDPIVNTVEPSVVDGGDDHNQNGPDKLHESEQQGSNMPPEVDRKLNDKILSCVREVEEMVQKGEISFEANDVQNGISNDLENGMFDRTPVSKDENTSCIGVDPSFDLGLHGTQIFAQEVDLGNETKQMVCDQVEVGMLTENSKDDSVDTSLTPCLGSSRGASDDLGSDDDFESMTTTRKTPRAKRNVNPGPAFLSPYATNLPEAFVSEDEHEMAKFMWSRTDMDGIVVNDGHDELPLKYLHEVKGTGWIGSQFITAFTKMLNYDTIDPNPFIGSEPAVERPKKIWFPPNTLWNCPARKRFSQPLVIDVIKDHPQLRDINIELQDTEMFFFSIIKDNPWRLFVVNMKNKQL